MKIGIIRCMQTEEVCPGTYDFESATKGEGAFAETGPVEVVGFVSCGGCPGKKAVFRARTLMERGAQAIALASCIGRGNPIGVPCPFFNAMKRAIVEEIGEDIQIFDFTH